jgi:hypothetical protein
MTKSLSLSLVLNYLLLLQQAYQQQVGMNMVFRRQLFVQV